MGDEGDFWKALKSHRQMLRDTFGEPCPGCKIKRPKASPTIMLPGHRCRVCGYVDPRPHSIMDPNKKD